MDTKRRLPVIGATQYVKVAGVSGVPAKIDTGADSSAIWASRIEMRPDGTLVFVLFDEKSPFFDGKLMETREYVAKSVRSSHGDTQVRYRVKLPLEINGRELEADFTLANRSRNRFPVLIGRRALEGNFVVDVSKSEILLRRPVKSRVLNEELKENPYEFHQKYIQKGEK